jgi:hypothetical protein
VQSEGLCVLSPKWFFFLAVFPNVQMRTGLFDNAHLRIDANLAETRN